MNDAGKRILIVNYEFPPLGGGAGTASWETARALGRMGYEPAVLTTWFRGLPRNETLDGVAVHRIPAFRRKAGASAPFEMALFILSAMWRVGRLVRQFKPACLLCYFSIPSGAVGWWARARCGVPYILSLRGGDVPGFHSGAPAAWHRLTMPLTRLIWRNAAAVTTNAGNLKELALKTMPGLNITVIPNGVDMERFSPWESARQTDERMTALFVGRLNAQKGLDALLRATGQIKKRLPEGFQLVLVGGGPEENRLKKLSADLGLETIVDFRGWTPPEKIPDAYREADFFVLPSRDEGMPNAALEAMASGLPVITTDIPGCTALVANGENGFIVPRGAGGEPDAAALARALERMTAEETTRRDMGKKGRERAASFSWDAAARRTAEAIDSARCVAESPRPAEP